MRLLRINRLKAFASGSVPFRIYIDGQLCGSVDNGDLWECMVDENKHIVRFDVIANGQRLPIKGGIAVPEGNYDQMYHIKGKIGGLDITADAEQTRINMERYSNDQLKINQQIKEQGYVEQAKKILKKIESADIGKRDYALLVNILRNGERNYLGYKNLMKDYVKNMIHQALEAYPDKTLMYDYIRDLSTIAECSKGMIPLKKAEQYLGTLEARTGSVFDDQSDIKNQIEQFKVEMQDRFGGKSIENIRVYIYQEVQKFDSLLNKFNVAVNKGDDLSALKCITLANASDSVIETLSMLPKYMIYDTFLEKQEGDLIQLSSYLRNVYEQIFCSGEKNEKDGEITFYPTTDMLIADILTYAKGSFIENIEEKLEVYFKGMQLEGKKHNVGGYALFCSKQCEIVRKMLELYKAPNQERRFLEYMYEYQIPRTESQERRLAFLKSSRQSNVKILEGSCQKDAFIYDYCFLGKKGTDVEKYIEAFTMESRPIKSPLVLEEWSKSVQKQGIQWKINEICQWIEQYLMDNFGERYHAELVQSAPLTEISNDFDASILIRDVAGKYPFLAYLITGEKMTLKQVDISLYAMLLSEECGSETDVILHNQKVSEWASVLYDKQNPKINNNIALMQSVVIEGMEMWLNNNCKNNDIYS